MGSNSQTTNQSQQSSYQPWNVAIPGLTNIIGQLSNGGGTLTPQQSTALSGLYGSTSSVPNYGAQGANAVSGMFNTTTAPQAGLWNSAYNTTANTLSPYLDPSYTNPMTAPGMGAALSTMNQDITNQVNSQFAAAGRSGSPANTQALARGLSQGEGGLIANEYNTLTGQQQNAANSLLGGAGATAAGTAGLGSQQIQDWMAAMQGGSALPGLYSAPSSAQLQAATAGQQLPYQNLQLPASLLAALGGLGGSSQGTGTSTTTQPVNPFTTALGAGLGLYALSDERLKEDIEPVGILFNGLTAYKYRFKGDPSARTHLGVMAQDVEKVRPDAVADVGLWRGGPSVKMVDYDKATAMAA